jgi:hypothetical protein
MAKLKNQTQPPAPEVDFEAALTSQQGDDDRKAPMRTLRSGKPIPTSYPIVEGPLKRRSQPKGSKATKKPKVSSSNPQANPPGSPHGEGDHIYNNINNINKGIDSKSNNYCSEVLSKQIDIDIKAKMTLQELNFLEIYLSGRVTIDKAMIQAGYGHYSQDWRYKLAQKIVIKYESQAADHRIIFRAMGAGEVAVVEGLLKLARGAKSEMVRLNAWSMIAKCIGLTKEQIEGVGGITIIFEQPDSPGIQPSASLDPGKPEQPQPVTYQAPNRVLQITK